MIIAIRILTLRRRTDDIKVPIRIHAPERDRTMSCWKCRYTVKWPDRTLKSEGFGDDQVQALTLTFNKIAVELCVSQEHRSGRLGWTEPGEGYGFPLAKVVRNRAVGYDKEFFA
jgi:hypothetical protein